MRVHIDLADLRLRAGLTVMSAAKRFGVSRRTWQRWELEGHVPEGAWKRLKAMLEEGGQDAR